MKKQSRERTDFEEGRMAKDQENATSLKRIITALSLRCAVSVLLPQVLELELIQTQMTQKPMLRAEVYARALRASQNRKEDSV